MQTAMWNVELSRLLRSNRELPRFSEFHMIALKRAFAQKGHTFGAEHRPSQPTSGFDEKIREALSGPAIRPQDSEEAVLIEI